MKEIRMKRRISSIGAGQEGFALPLAMMMLLVIAATAAIFSRQSTELFSVSKTQEVASDTFYRSEGVLFDAIRQMARAPELWSSLAPVADLPSDYSFYQATAYVGTGGIPNCSGKNCHRNMIPIGGALIKNIGPLASDGAEIDTTAKMHQQLDEENLPDADLTFDGKDVYYQVERLGKRLEPVNAIGSDLDSNNPNAGNAQLVQYRLTGYALREVKSKMGRSVIVTVVEVPPV